MSEKLRVGILGATGMVGQRFISLLENHPWFELQVREVQERHTKRQLEEDGKWILQCRRVSRILLL